MKIDNLNEIAKYEKAIKEKYGSEAIKNPKSGWDENKEKEYLQDLKKFYSRKSKKKTTIESEGFSLITKADKSTIPRVCPTCGEYSMKSTDDIYMVKFDCCFKCYIQYVEGREERWKTGWRPSK